MVKTVIATRLGYDQLGISMATEAYHRGFNKAAFKAFLGDGLKVNGSLWSRHFPHYTPITDLMHAISYVYAAAIATRNQIDEGWTLYFSWCPMISATISIQKRSGTGDNKGSTAIGNEAPDARPKQ